MPWQRVVENKRVGFRWKSVFTGNNCGQTRREVISIIVSDSCPLLLTATTEFFTNVFGISHHKWIDSAGLSNQYNLKSCVAKCKYCSFCSKIMALTLAVLPKPCRTFECVLCNSERIDWFCDVLCSHDTWQQYYYTHWLSVFQILNHCLWYGDRR